MWTRGSALSDNQNPDTWCRDSAQLTRHDPPLLYNLDTDPGATRPRPGYCRITCHVSRAGERWDVSAAQPRLAQEMGQLLAAQAAKVHWAPSQMARGNEPAAAPCCNKVPKQSPKQNKVKTLSKVGRWHLMIFYPL